MTRACSMSQAEGTWMVLSAGREECGLWLGGRHLRLLITDPFHPVTAPTMTALRGRCPGCAVVGVHPQADAVPPPPGVDAVMIVPEPEEPGYGDIVAGIAREHELDTILPWTDRDALAIARRADRLLECGLAVVCPRRELVELSCDKWATMRRLGELGVVVPASRLVQDGAGLIRAAVELGYPDRPLMLKPRTLSGGRGVWRLRLAADPTRTSPRPELPVEAMAVLLDGGSDGPQSTQYLVQQEIAGTDTSVDVLADEARVLAAVARTRDATLGGLCVAGTVHPVDRELRGLLDMIVRGLGWSGVANVQLVAGETGPVVYEINARASGSIGVCAHAGLDMLAAAIHLARVGGPPPGLTAIAAVPSSIGFRRSWQDQWWTSTGVAP